MLTRFDGALMIEHGWWIPPVIYKPRWVPSNGMLGRFSLSERWKFRLKDGWVVISYVLKHYEIERALHPPKEE